MLLRRILVYPIKSLDGVSVSEARISPGGILEFDRTFAMVDAAGACVNGKRDARVHRLRATFDPLFQEVCLWPNGDSSRHHFSLAEPGPLNEWLSAYFGFVVRLIAETERGFPDDKTASGPTITSEASLQTVSDGFPGLDVAGARRRFRSNLEIGNVAPFWEDHLFGAPGELQPFRIGPVQFLGHNPCQRCVVPTRDPDRGEPIPDFQQSFTALRRRHLPAWSNPDRFNHYYRFATNTSVPASEAGKWLRVGDPVSIG